MQPEDRDAAYLWDMLRTSRKIIDTLEGVERDAYLADEDLRLIVERRLEIIGELRDASAIRFAPLIRRSRGGESSASATSWPTSTTK